MGTFKNKWQGNNLITEFSGSLLTSGSITITGSISAQTFYGDGSSLTNLTASLVTGSDVKLASLNGVDFTVQQMQNEAHSAGRVKGGEISISASLFLVNSGSGMIRATNDVTANVLRFDFASTSSTIPTDTVRYVGVQYNAGTPNVVFKSVDTWDNDTDFPLGVVVNDDSGLHHLNNPQDVVNHIYVMANRSYETMPFTRDRRNGGLALTSTDRTVQVSEGAFWDRFARFVITSKDTNASDRFDYYYTSGSSYNVTLTQSQWDNGVYNNNGTLTPLSSSYYTNCWIFAEADDELIAMYGNNQYVSQSDAEGENVPGINARPNRIRETCYYVGQIVIQSGSSAPTTVYNSYDVKTVGAVAGGPGGTNVHNDLTGLQGGQSGQYYHLTSAEYSDLGSASDITSNTNRIQSLENVTGSYATTSSLNDITSSVNSLNSKTGSYATTGSNTFIGNQTVTGSLTVTQIGNVPTWLKFTASYLDLNTAATQVSTSIYNLPAGAILQGAVTKRSAGWNIPVSMSLGINTEKDRYADLFDASGSSPVNDTTFGVWQNFDMQNWGSSTPIVLYATSSVNLSTATAGNIEVYLYVAQVKQ